MSRTVLLVSTLCAATIAASSFGCHVAGCAEGDLVCAQQTTDPGTATTEEPDTTDDPPPTTGSTGPTGDTGDTDTTEQPDTTIGPGPNCGNGELEVGEACDDGNLDNSDACVDCAVASCGDGFTQFGVEGCDDGNSDETDDCTNACALAACGDGVLHAPEEKCDDGPDNSDTAYDGCTTKCQLGPRCGDGKVDGPETCDDQNSDATDGCLGGCVEATSCLQIHDLAPDSPSGIHRIWPAALSGDIDVSVWCDMDSDGGGYTFLKIDTQVMGESDKGAVAAEMLCQAFGMRLLVTRSEAHVLSAYSFATQDNLLPLGGGTKGSGVDYLAILGIYPAMPGATCEGAALNSVDCPGWRASDDHAFWVTDQPDADEPSNEHCAGCSMLYKWNMDGTSKSYTTFPSGEGAGTFRFLCDIGDKF